MRMALSKGMNMFSAIIFDLDGIIADTESVQVHAINLMLQPFGHNLTRLEWAQKYVGRPIEQDVRDLHARFQLPAPLDEVSAQRRKWYRELLEQGTELQMLPGLERFLDGLRDRQIPLGIASGSPRADIDTVLRTLHLTDRFGTIAAADQVTNPKPAPDVYLLAARQLNAPVAECIAIEDSATGMTAAKSAGMRVIGIPSDYTRHHDLSTADVLVSSFDDLHPDDLSRLFLKTA